MERWKETEKAKFRQNLSLNLNRRGVILTYEGGWEKPKRVKFVQKSYIKPESGNYIFEI